LTTDYPLNLNVTFFSPNAAVELLFSDKIRALSSFMQFINGSLTNETMNVTALNQLKSQVFELKYTSNMYNQSSPKVPKLESWNFVNVDTYKINLQLNFSNSLYVSSDAADTLDIQVIDSFYF